MICLHLNESLDAFEENGIKCTFQLMGISCTMVASDNKYSVNELVLDEQV
jgi:hypothetical protein